MYRVCLLSCQVGVQTFPSTINALSASQSLPCLDGNRGRGWGYSPLINSPLAFSVCEWCFYEVTVRLWGLSEDEHSPRV